MTPTCPICAKPATATQTTYGTRHACCGLWSWNGKPLVDKATHDARQLAHLAFDPLWKGKRMSRGTAYRRLRAITGWPEAECHMSNMSADQALRVPALVQAIVEQAA